MKPLCRFAFVACVSALVAACTTETSSPSVDALSFADVPAPDFESASSLDGGLVTVAEFDAYVDPANGVFEISLREMDAWHDQGAASAIRTATEELFCPLRVTTGRVDTIGAANVPASLGFTPTDCGFPNVLPYSTLGTFCGGIRLTSYYTSDLDNVYAEILAMDPAVGHNGFAHPFGNGADPALIPTGEGAPNPAGPGLFSYGTLAAGGSTDAQWVFEYTPEPFRFQGRFIASFVESENGADDDCDGRVDEGIGVYPDGAICVDGIDCESGNCDGGLCASACPPNMYGPGCGVFCEASTTCNGNGSCDTNGDCACVTGFVGAACDVTCDPATDCSGNGACNAMGTCDCAAGFYGADCSVACDAATDCNGNGTCDVAGACVCDSGYDFQPDCSVFCDASASCSDNGTCDVNGDCDCDPGFFGADCSQACDPVGTCNSNGTCDMNGLCACDANYYGADCATLCEASTTCSGNGTCDMSGACSCSAGFYGADCSVACDGAINCNGNGTCDMNGACSCSANYYGADCSAFCDAATTCGGNGTCDMNGACACDANYYGADCAAFCDAATTCGGNGTCDMNGACSCGANYYGADCSTFCDAATSCGGNGTCDGAGACDCDPGFFGSDCSQACDAATTCNNNGTCDMAGLCACDANYYGADCSTFCEASTTCGGNGTCDMSGACACDANYYGADCSSFCNAATTCGGNGSCDVSGDCACDANYYGADCSAFCDAAITCGGNGSCDAAGACDCDPGYFGAGCSTFCSDAITCSGNGTCDGSGVCGCDADYFGADCGTFCNAMTSCNSNGTCDAAGACACSTDYYGADCGTFCSAATTCGGNGSCDMNGACSCDANYYGADCSTFCDATTTCGGNGTCDGAGACSCDANYFGNDCSTFCEAGATCNGNGTCDGAGACSCDANYFGNDCSTFCEASTTCNGNGTCDGAGACVCSGGFSGADCSVCPDADMDGVCDAVDACPGGDDNVDTDTDGTADFCDGCPNDINKLAPGTCGCGVVDTPGCGATGCGNGIVDGSPTSTVAVLEYVPLDCEAFFNGGSGQDLTVTLEVNGTAFGPFTPYPGSASGCNLGLSVEAEVLEASAFGAALLETGTNAFRVVTDGAAGNGIKWATLTIVNSGESVTLYEQFAGDAAARNLVAGTPYPGPVDATVNPTITVLTTEECDDGNMDNADGCSTECVDTSGGYCGDGVPGNSTSIGTPAVEFRYVDSNTSGNPYTLTFYINGIVAAEVLNDPGNFCGQGGSFVSATNADAIASMRDGDNTFSYTVSDSAARLSWAKAVNNANGQEAVIHEETVGDAASEATMPCPFFDSPDFATTSSAGLSSAEACDDGDATEGDGCDSNCTVSACGNGIVAPGETCDWGTFDALCNVDCSYATCGDGWVQGAETCDDGNLVSGDGCSSSCVNECGNGLVAGGAITSLEFEYHAEHWMSDSNLTILFDDYVAFTDIFNDSADFSEPVRTIAITDPVAVAMFEAGTTVITVRAGDYRFGNSSWILDWARLNVNGTPAADLYDSGSGNIGTAATGLGSANFVEVVRFVYGGREGCDDGNNTDGDGCSAICEREGCGNGFVDLGEECDDGNNNNGDGCSATCTNESCANGTIEGAETCDDGGTTPGDGCSAICQLEVCGNGVLDAGETCDDGNLVGGDGCSVSCSVESCGNGIVDVGEGCDGGANCSGGCQITNCVEGLDSDGDRIPDCAETNTGVYVSLADTGTDPNNSDSDGDGASDGDELLGTTAGLDLPGLGANPNRASIFLEIDWTSAPSCAYADHRPSDWEIEASVDMFAQAPVSNPDGSRGIDLIIDYGQGGVFTGGNLLPGNDEHLDDGLDTEFDAYKATNFASERNGYFYYGIIAKTQGNGAGGLGELPGNDFNVTQGCIGEQVARMGTIVHELGHNLGLGHGGNESCNYKPSYDSIMNYSNAGGDSDCNGISDAMPDFSAGDRVSIDENNVNEFAGVCGDVPVDFDNSGGFNSGYARDLNDNAGGYNAATQISHCGAQFTTLNDHDDWGNLNYFGPRSNGDNQVTPILPTCEPPRPLATRP